MALPAFRALGTFASGTTSCTPGLPTGHTTDDILVLIVECDDSETPNTPSGWTSLGSANEGADVKLTVFIKRHDGSETAPTVDGTTNHIHAWIGAYSGVENTGSPWLLGSFFTNTAAGTVTYPGITTEFDDALVLLLTAIGDNANDTENLSGYTNGALSSLTDRDDEAETTGTGGGLGFADGGKASAGATGDSSCTHDNAVGTVAVHLALYSTTAGGATTLTADSGSYSHTGTAADLDIKMPADSGSYAHTGTAATLKIGMPAAVGVYDVTGTAATLKIVMPAGEGSYSIAGQDASLESGIFMSADSGVYGLVGSSVSNADFAVFFGKGATNGSLGAFTPGLPACTQKGDYQLVIMETADEAITVATANGFTEHPASPISVPNADINIATRMTIYERLWDGSSDIPTLPSFNDAGDHIIGTILVFRPKAGLEWTSLDEVRSASNGVGWAVASEATEDTSGVAASLQTDEDDVLIVGVVVAAKPDSSSTTNLSGITNAELNNITEIADTADPTGNGGMIAAWTGESPFRGDLQVPPNPIGTTSFTLANASYKAMLTLALYPGPRALTELLLNCPRGSYFINGDAVTFRINAAQEFGVYGLTGTDATLIGPAGGATMTADPGAYSKSGTANVLAIMLPGDAGSYALSGTDAALLFRDLALTADSGGYSCTGVDATLSFVPAGGEPVVDSRNWLLQRQTNPHWRFLKSYRQKYKRGGGVGGIH